MMKHLFLSLLICLGFGSCQKETKPVTFAIVSDIHQDIAHDAEERFYMQLKRIRSTLSSN